MSFESAKLDGNPVSDLMQENGSEYIVTGFFTPDYYPLAVALAKNLENWRTSFHLYACDKQQGGWVSQTLRKPSILKRARIDYPARTIILMDVDCSIRGDISGILDVKADIAVPMGRKPMKNGTALKPGTRVVLVRPTPMVDEFLEAWDLKCRLDIRPVENDEIRLQMAIEDSAGKFAFAILPSRYTGMELRKAKTSDVIVHDSARDEARFLGSFHKSLKVALRNSRNSAYRWITGREYKSVGSR